MEILGLPDPSPMGVAQATPSWEIMANRQLSVAELENANALLAEIRSKLETMRSGDMNLLFAYRMLRSVIYCLLLDRLISLR
jgi:hypothetical protein